MLEKIKNDHPETIETINSSGKLDEETKNKLVEVIETLKKEHNNA